MVLGLLLAAGAVAAVWYAASQPSAAHPQLAAESAEEPVAATPLPAAHPSYRAPAVAGSWYPDQPAELAALVDGFLKAAGTEADCSALPEAVVSPHAGYRFSGPVAGHAFAAVRGCHVRRVWVLGPSHKLPIKGVALYRDEAFLTPLGNLPLDTAVLERLAGQDGFAWLEGSDGGEHSIEMELPLLQRALGSFELVPLLVGELDPDGARAVASVLRDEIGPGDLVVVSGDFTHYGPNFSYTPFTKDLAKELHKLDHGAWDSVADPDPDEFYRYRTETGATICGRNPLLLLSALVAEGTFGTELAYDTSGAITENWTNSVSYLAGRLDGPSWSGKGPQHGVARLVEPKTGEALLELAQESLEHWFETGTPLEVDPSKLPPDSQKVLGAFVTLETADGSLRGCIGEIVARRQAWEAVAARAVDAAIHDRRFKPVTAEEFKSLSVEVTLLGPSRKVGGPESIIVGRHGVVMTQGRRVATFLPQVAPEQSWDRWQTLNALARKAGIDPRQIRSTQLEVYEAQVIEGHD